MENPDNLGRDRLVAAIMESMIGQDLLSAPDVQAELEREVDEAGAGAVLALKERIGAEYGWEYYPRDPLAQRVHHLLADRFLAPGSELRGAEQLAGLDDAPVVIVANHLSYADANVIEVLLQRGGAAAVANRLTAIAGPKVFTSRERRFSSLCFGTIKVPQSADVSSEEAVLSPRDVARAARRAIEVARDRLRRGDVLVLFAEGTRSRTGSMRPMLAAAARYLDEPGTWVLPAGLAGPETLFSLEQSLQPARVVMQLGTPIRAELLLAHASGDRRVAMDAIGLAVAELVPPSYRGVYASGSECPDAMRALEAIRQTA